MGGASLERALAFTTMRSEPRPQLPKQAGPADLRPDERRRHAAESPSGDIERDARNVVSRLTGQRVVIQDDGVSFRKPDLRIEYVDRTAVVEVVADMAPDHAATYSNLRRRGGQIPATIGLSAADRMWWVNLVSGAHVGRLLEDIAAAIEGLGARLGEEVPGILTPLDELPQTNSTEVQVLRGLGVAEIGSRPLEETEEAVIHVRGPRVHGPSDVTWDELLEWVREYLSGPRTKDVREKLSDSGADERHVFVAASSTSPWAVYHGLAGALQGLPPEPPALPTEITHLWLWTVPPTGRCLAWWPDRGWFEPRYHWAASDGD